MANLSSILFSSCPLTEYNVTTGQRIIVICSQRERLMIQRIYLSYSPDTIYVCDTFDPDVHIVGSCLSGLRHFEVPLTVCEKGLDCQIPLEKGKPGLLFCKYSFSHCCENFYSSMRSTKHVTTNWCFGCRL
ncbi:hypothetical protein FBUS_05956 [Fasciolopsis buskii]|uniref:Uncharacterized protein n=1 Tax=Fasciolopsis buskii TaxID=27845 RepID=A0A8E0S0G5_9TREM|nr:hypothetical protein FBUS_05956 [Fasciolopsis buski]